MADTWTRRDFIIAGAAIAGSTRFAGAATQQPQAQTPEGPVVLFQGDSITDCGRNRNSADANNAGALGTGYPLLVASAVLAAYPERGYRFYNRGVSGNKVPDLQQRWTTDTLDLRPDVMSILIGVNDFWHKLDHGYNGTVQDYEQQYTALLDETRRALPRVRIIVIEPFVLRCGAVDQRWFPEFDQRRAAAARVAKQARVGFIPMQAVFNERVKSTPPQYWAADGVHPTQAGHALIAERWRKAFG